MMEEAAYVIKQFMMCGRHQTWFGSGKRFEHNRCSKSCSVARAAHIGLWHFRLPMYDRSKNIASSSYGLRLLGR